MCIEKNPGKYIQSIQNEMKQGQLLDGKFIAWRSCIFSDICQNSAKFVTVVRNGGIQSTEKTVSTGDCALEGGQH